jgi:hypothetical protein
MRPLILSLAVASLAHAAAAQPADCLSEPAPTQSMPLDLDLNGLPGVPKGLGGQVYADVPVAPPGGTMCETASPALPRDVLRGEPGDLLRGNGPRTLSGAPVRPRVEIVAPDPEDGR